MNKLINLVAILLVMTSQLEGQNVGIGTSTPIATLDVNSPTDSYTSRFNGPNQMFVGFTENTILRGYIGSFAGLTEDFDIGTSSNNTVGKLHFTTLAQPRMTINNTGNIGIGTTTPTTSAALEISSTSRGFLPPRMTKSQRDAIISPAEGLSIYNTTSRCFETWDGSQWYGPCNIQAESYPAGTVFCDDIVTKVIPVLSPMTGKTWMDRNLGASRVANSSTDANSYGDLYQWGRRSDGHQCRNSSTTTNLNSDPWPNHGNFIVSNTGNWMTTPDDDLWQQFSEENNPCPSNYRLPTVSELDAERQNFSSQNAVGAFASPLKLPMAGNRNYIVGSLQSVGTAGLYWTSSIGSDYNKSWNLLFNNNEAGAYSNFRSFGYSVRCIKE